MVTLKERELAGFFPEYDLIRDEDLKQKVYRIWAKACSEADWDSLEDIPFSPDYPAQPNSFLQHVRLVTAYSYAVALKNNELEGVSVNLDYVIAGAILHDVCKIVEYSAAGGRTAWGKNVTHGIYGIALCYAEKVPIEIIHIIASHTKQLTIANKSREAIIISRCDQIAAACVHLYEAQRSAS